MMENGYILISKLHTRDSFFKWKSSNIIKANIVPHIEPCDTHEMIKYSDKAISFGTTMVYQTYLFDLPVLDIGTRKYYFGWSDYETNLSMSPLKHYNYGVDLIYGQVAPDFDKKLRKYIN